MVRRKFLFTLLFGLLGTLAFISCRSSRWIPLESAPPPNNSTYIVTYLFEKDGVKVYRFYDSGDYVYFTTKGDVTKITTDSTKTRTVTINGAW